MICKPYKEAKQNHITQGFGANPCSWQPNGHTGVDFAYVAGTFLVAPELCMVSNIIDSPAKIDTDLAPMERGYGIVLKSLISTDVYYLYWHCSPIFPVKIGDKVMQGQPVAQMSNSGFVLYNGQSVPVDIRTIPPYKGTHLHVERFVEVNGVRTYTDITKFIGWDIPVQYDVLTAIQNVISKIIGLFK